MVPKKGKSKRMSASKRYKILKRVAEHHRKLRKEAKKNPHKHKQKKDPGIPANYPYKEQLLAQIEAAKRDSANEKLLREERQRQFAQQEKKKQKKKQKKLDKAVAAASAGKGARVKRTIEWRELLEREEVDVVVEVLDARDPLGTRVKAVERLVTEKGKKLVFALNKIEFVPREVVKSWLNYLRTLYPTHLVETTAVALRGSRCVGVVGLVHVGKSAVVRELEAVGMEVVEGRGVSVRAIGEAEILRGGQVKHVEDAVSLVDSLFSRCSKEALQLAFNAPTFSSTPELLAHLQPSQDIQIAARSILKEWSKSVKYYTTPPKPGKKSEKVSDEIRQAEEEVLSNLLGKKEFGECLAMSAKEFDFELRDPKDREQESEDDAMEEDELQEEDEDEDEEIPDAVPIQTASSSSKSKPRNKKQKQAETTVDDMESDEDDAYDFARYFSRTQEDSADEEEDEDEDEEEED
ncbi:uncharacterized protein VTP21DRAFT_8236 [Calcarisporiella thermophila]|uniref:uncharacterized protein n=1 Tax=Calcarisporiella thermophila TaxID=911321 RepID=UPI003742407F